MISSVLLIRPAAEGKLEFPFSLLYVATALKQAGYPVEIFDFHATSESSIDLVGKLKEMPRPMLGIGALSGSYSWVKKLTLNLKKELPQLSIIVGGHVAISHEILLNNTGVDYVCLGEGEITFPALIDALNKHAPLDDIPGLSYKKDGQIITTPKKLLKDFLLPDFSLINPSHYLLHPNQDRFFKRDKRYQARSNPSDKLATLMFSRGCLGGCNFCYRHLPGYRQGKIEWCWDYLMKLYRDYGVRYFRIDDELFISNKEWFDEFYHKIKESKIDIMFRVSGLRVDSVDDDILAKLREIGCIAINYGIESGSQKILDSMNKRVTVEQNKLAIQKTLARGMQVMAYIMLGYLGETKETIRQTLKLLLATDIRSEDVDIFFTVPLPGTRLYRHCLETGLIKDEEKFLENLYTTIKNQYDRYSIQLGDLTRKELLGFEKKIYFLISLRQLIPYHSFIFKIIQSIVFLIPDKSRVNIILVFGKKFLQKIIHLLNK